MIKYNFGKIENFSLIPYGYLFLTIVSYFWNILIASIIKLYHYEQYSIQLTLLHGYDYIH